MKRTFPFALTLGTVLAGSVLASCALAAEPTGGYVGALAGSARISIDGVDGSENRFTWGLFAGYRFNPYIATELGFYKPRTYVYDDGTNYLSFSNSTPAVSLLLGTPINEVFSAYARVGAARPRLKVFATNGVTSVEGTSSSTELLYGAGISVHLGQGSIRAEFSRVNSDMNANLISVSAVFHFPQYGL